MPATLHDSLSRTNHFLDFIHILSRVQPPVPPIPSRLGNDTLPFPAKERRLGNVEQGAYLIGLEAFLARSVFRYFHFSIYTVMMPFIANKAKYSQYAPPVKEGIGSGKLRRENDGGYLSNGLRFVDISVLKAYFVPQRGKAFLETAGDRDRAMTSTGTSDTDGQITTSLSLE